MVLYYKRTYRYPKNILSLSIRHYLKYTILSFRKFNMKYKENVLNKIRSLKDTKIEIICILY